MTAFKRVCPHRNGAFGRKPTKQRGRGGPGSAPVRRPWFGEPDFSRGRVARRGPFFTSGPMVSGSRSWLSAARVANYSR